MIFSWRILMRVVILILPVVLGWVSGVATPSRDVDRGYSDGPTNFNSYRRMYVRRFFVFHSLTFVLVFDTLRSPDVSGLASDEATLAPVACGGRSDCRELSSFLILFWTCVVHVHYLYRVWAFFICFLVLQRTVEWIALRSFRIDLIHLSCGSSSFRSKIRWKNPWRTLRNLRWIWAKCQNIRGKIRSVKRLRRQNQRVGQERLCRKTIPYQRSLWSI